MTPRYSLLQQLIGRFAEYDQATRQPSLADFGAWLAGHEAPVEPAPAPEPAAATGPLAPDRGQVPYYDLMPAEQQLGPLLGRLSHFAQRYAAEGLGGLPIGSLREFGVLAVVGFHGNPTKTEVAATNLMEMSTVTEVSRRLVRASLLGEAADHTDRRTRRLQLTPEGRRVLNDATHRMETLNGRLFGPLAGPQQAQLLQLLYTLNEVHTNQFFAPHADGAGQLPGR